MQNVVKDKDFFGLYLTVKKIFIMFRNVYSVSTM
jgi:hypothetical protein